MTGGWRSEKTKQGRRVKQQPDAVQGGQLILNPHLSALNYFLVLGYPLPEYDYVSSFTVRYL